MTIPAVIRRAAAVAGAAAGFLLFRRGRRTAAAGGRGHDSGGTAGVREPRNPVPPTLVDAGAAEPQG